MVSSLKERERTETERSAQEAAQTASANFATEPEQVARYTTPQLTLYTHSNMPFTSLEMLGENHS